MYLCRRVEWVLVQIIQLAVRLDIYSFNALIEYSMGFIHAINYQLYLTKMCSLLIKKQRSSVAIYNLLDSYASAILDQCYFAGFGKIEFSTRASE